MIYDTIVIGGGVVGLSVAWRLGERGKRVLLVERSTVGAGTSRRGVGGVRQQFSTAINIALSQMSLPVFAELGDRIGWQQHGYLYLALSKRVRGELWQRATWQQAHGVPVELLEPEDVCRRFPYLRVDDVWGAAFCAADGYVLPALVLAAFERAAINAGVTIAEGARVTGVRVVGGRVAGVKTSAGSFDAPCVVNAAGAWAAVIGALANIAIPVAPLKRQAWLTVSTDSAPPTAPLTIDTDTGWHFRPREGALCLAMASDEQPGDNLIPDPALGQRMLAAAQHRLPALNVGLAQGWAGLYEVTPDAHPIIGEVCSLPGFWLACGFSGHGLMHAPAIGMVLAGAICGESLPLDIAPLGLDRFEAGQLLGDGQVL